MERDNFVDGLTENEAAFIGQQNSFYMATVGQNGYPYLQHRGGPKGFVKVLDETRIGFVDFTGNMQYISVENIATNNKVAIIMVDYPSMTRLKLLATAEIVELAGASILYALLTTEDYKHKPERMMVFTIEAYDWNCPQHITPRYTTKEIETALTPQKELIEKLQPEVRALKERLQLQIGS